MNTQTPYCFTRIRAVYSKLSDKERMVADYILEQPDKIIHSTISQVAEDIEIADATVFRFCKRIGFKGYQAMKIALASEVVSPIKEIHDTITEDDDEATIVQKVFKSNIKTIEDTLQVIDPEQFKKAVSALTIARKIEFYGSGGSGAIAMDGHHKFLRSGLLTSCYTDAHLQIMSASQLTEQDVVVCISHSGTSKDIIESLEVAKSRGATTIGITNYSKTPLSKKADITLFTVSEETEFRSEALASRLAQLTIIDALYVNVSVKLKDEMQASLKRMRNAVAIKRV
ncbi:MurR/RpiR family transcriptional regulator [Bacillus luteolus]|uniref:MurR/RpiR family transcriptional regulator n=1 Tax=Litchfieldia luteola TaxID=682179 RepID=A0ABR9QEF3_9BACI|nr:MurR/RpiR family transcriptional regulator [Cytobacillus luteolus]MBE4906881.1 MurR/RpiR family transcriptional regulator [Cytobacillus luteolus]MBP1940464.1 DNA-binding MurR/RpiR family transcriptional regulator [Cytobacillus luteolus]